MNQEKYWRYSSVDEFYEDAIQYIDNHISGIERNIDSFCIEKIPTIKDLINSYKAAKESNMEVNKLLAIGCKVVEKDVKDWSTFSTDPNSTLKDIMLRILIGKMYSFNYVCLLLTCNNLNLTSDFIADAIYVRSELFRFDEWDDKHVSVVAKCATSGANMKDDINIMSLYSYRKITRKPIPIVYNLDDLDKNLLADFESKYGKPSSVKYHI